MSNIETLKHRIKLGFKENSIRIFVFLGNLFAFGLMIAIIFKLLSTLIKDRHNKGVTNRQNKKRNELINQLQNEVSKWHHAYDALMIEGISRFKAGGTRKEHPRTSRGNRHKGR
jgi:hypothetical protein